MGLRVCSADAANAVHVVVACEDDRRILRLGAPGRRSRAARIHALSGEGGVRESCARHGARSRDPSAARAYRARRLVREARAERSHAALLALSRGDAHRAALLEFPMIAIVQ